MKNFDFIPSRGTVTSPKGYKASGIYCGLKRKNKDLCLLVSDSPATVVGMFTSNNVPAHCVVYNKERVQSGRAQALIVNAGNANCCTGQRGWLDNLTIAEKTAALLGLDAGDVLVLSTGVIGEPMPMNKVKNGIAMAVEVLSYDGGVDAARAIMTTDTVPKHFSIELELDGKTCTIGAMAKGSGMIHPNLATMFGIFTTDVAIDRTLLDAAFRDAVNDSFNMMTVDGETSTNDTVLLFANGAAGNSRIIDKNENHAAFAAALKQIAKEAAKAIAEDGEGATKLVTVTVDGAVSKEEAIRAAKSIAKSLLVKTAIFGNDPNWGRVVQSAGASGVQINLQKFGVEFAGVKVAENGGAIPFDREETIQMLKNKNVQIKIDLGAGSISATVFTCDLTYDYVTINAEYHT
ncbi:bifunctional glutamate N-acetyltransferase/amino-acid acetyltransferase ArgJ [candidate division KSB1 bacterium]|nr:bifunctional glutamate N-acetyltransferase/amino-acid acetyltransferase ArgJ [candidate division KSB1 bacterium]RQW00412.1 MAG: bifunctional glutamate N-acetyltransferase/amino-acid acetyltransferase ArgJ [candidate division KSB1 bacterium]